MKSFKKILSVFSAIAIVITCFSTVMLPTAYAFAEPVNIAPQGVGFDSNTDGLDVSGSKDGDNIYYQGTTTAENLNDGGISNTNDDCWQYAKSDKDGGIYDITNVYCGIKFDVPVYVTEFSVLGITGVTEANSGDGFVPDGYTLSYYDGTSWHDVSATVSEDSKSVSHTFAEETKIFGVKITFTKRYSWHPKVAEIDIQGRIGGVEAAKLALSDALSRADALESAVYTEDSWAILQNAIDAANALDLDNATDNDDGEIFAAAEAIINAIGGLVNYLVVAMEKAAQYNESYYLYRAESYSALRNAVNTAASLVESGNTDFATLQAAESAINSAIEAMVLTSGNIAPSATAYAESEYDTAKTADCVNNGNMTDRWQSATGLDDGATWIMLDFGEATSMNIFDITWEINRANGDGLQVQYSDDNNTWHTASNVAVSDFILEEIPDVDAGNYYKQSITFDKITARYVRIYITSAVDKNKNPSIYEWEIYYNALAEFGAQGAQIRDNASNSSNRDLRFLSVISEKYYTDYVLGIESVGTLVARADQLKSDELSFETLETASYRIANLRAAYFNNADTPQSGDYVFVAAILNISDVDRNYVARSYIRFSDGSIIYGKPVMRCVRDGMFA